MKAGKKTRLTKNQLIENVDGANKRTLAVVDTFVCMIGMALRDYPQGDLRDFLADQAVIFAVCVNEGRMMIIDDLGWFFGECGFDFEEVQEMIEHYDGIDYHEHHEQPGQQLMLWGNKKA